MYLKNNLSHNILYLQINDYCIKYSISQSTLIVTTKICIVMCTFYNNLTRNYSN